MSGTVPANDRTRERNELLYRAANVNSSHGKAHLLALVARLAEAATECPRMSCTYCEHQARSEAQKQREVGEAEAG